MAILFPVAIILVGACAIMCIIQGSKKEKEFIEWVNK